MGAGRSKNAVVNQPVNTLAVCEPPLRPPTAGITSITSGINALCLAPNLCNPCVNTNCLQACAFPNLSSYILQNVTCIQNVQSCKVPVPVPMAVPVPLEVIID